MHKTGIELFVNVKCDDTLHFNIEKAVTALAIVYKKKKPDAATNQQFVTDDWQWQWCDRIPTLTPIDHLTSSKRKANCFDLSKTHAHT